MKSPSNNIAQDLDTLRGLLDSLQRQLTGSTDVQQPLHYVRARKMRQELFPGKYFGDPAWDIIVELYVAALSGKTFATSDIGLEAGIPMTTVLRYLALLEQDGIVQRWSDPSDGRRVLVKLTERGTHNLQQIFARPKASAEAEGELKLAA